jgi:O-antigen ligase
VNDARRQPGREAAFAWILGVGLVLLWLAHWPAGWGQHNSFDLPKRLLWPLLLAACAVWGWFRHGPRGSALAALAAALVMWMVAVTLGRPGPIAGGLEGLAVWTLPWIAFWIGSLFPARAWVLRRVVTVLVIAGAIQAVFMVLQYAGWDPWFGRSTPLPYRPGRMIGSIGYHNQAADALAVVAALSWVLPLRPGWRVGYLSLVGGVVALTGSRGASLGFLLSQALAIGLVAGPRIRARHLVGVLVGVGGLLLVPPDNRARFAELLRPTSSSAWASRQWMARAALAQWAERPLVGWGAGTFAYQYMERLAEVLPERRDHDHLPHLVYARETHQDALQMGAEFGAVGLAGGLILLVFILRVGARGRPTRRAAVTALAVHLAVHGQCSFAWQTSFAAPLAGLGLGMLLAPILRRPSPVLAVIHRPYPRLLGAGALLAVALQFAWAVRENLWNLRFTPQDLAAPPSAWNSDFRYRASAGAQAAADGQPEQALPHLQRAWAGHRDPRLLENLVRVLLTLHREREALPLLHTWLRSGLNHQEALLLSATAQERLGDFAAARQALAEHVRLWPLALPARDHRLAALWLKARQPAEALKVLARYVDAPEITAATLPGRLDAEGRSDLRPVRLSWCPLAAPTDRAWQRLRLPDDPNVIVLAITVREGSRRRPVPLTGLCNRFAYTVDDAPLPPAQSLDGRGFRLPVALAGDTALREPTAERPTGWWLTEPLPGQPNAVACRGQRVTVDAPAGAILDLLLVAVNSPLPRRVLAQLEGDSGQLPIPLRVSDWCGPLQNVYRLSDPESAGLLGLAGAAWLMLEAPEAALVQLQASLARDPGHSITQRNLEQCRRLLERRASPGGTRPGVPSEPSSP